MSAMAEEVPSSTLTYTNEEGAAIIGVDFVKPSTLARLARKDLVPHCRNGRRQVAWTLEQLHGVVEYFSRRSEQPPKRATSPKKESAPTRHGNVAPLESKPARRYGRQAANA